MQRVEIKIGGMTCAGCVHTVEKAIRGVDGIRWVSVSLNSESAHLELADKVNGNVFKTIAQKVEEKGYKVLTEKIVFILDLSASPDIRKLVERIESISGVVSAKINYALEELEVNYIPLPNILKNIENEIKSFGIEIKGAISKFSPEQDFYERKTRKLKRMFYTSLPSSIYFVLKMIFGFHISGLLDFFIATPPFILGMTYFGKGFFKKIKEFSFDMNFLISLGVFSAYISSSIDVFFPNFFRGEVMFFESSSVIVSVMFLGRFIESRIRKNVGSALRKLAELEPQKVKVLKDGVEQELNSEDVKKGDLVVLREGERVSNDGVLVSGEIRVDESHITGELQPVKKLKGDKVWSGSLVVEGSGVIEVQSELNETVLRKIIYTLKSAQMKKTTLELFADKISQLFTPSIIVISFITFFVWFFVSDLSFALERAISVLVVACPCALGLATPTAIANAVSYASRFGIIISNGSIFEVLPKIRSVFFDKTGTITEGKLSVSKIVFSDGERKIYVIEDINSLKQFSEEKIFEFLSYVASAELFSSHPISSAILNLAKEYNLKLSNPETHFYLKGKGLFAKVNSKEIVIGNEKILKDFVVNLKNLDELMSFVKSEISEGKINTYVFVAIDGVLRGIITLEDKLKSSAKEVISFLKKNGLKVFLLTGDKREVARKVSDELGLDGFWAELLPDEKIKIISEAKDKVMMVGDGINDAPAIEQADIGVAVRSGSEITRLTADVVVPDLPDLKHLFELGRKTSSVIKQNLFWAFSYNLFLVPAAAGVFFSLGIYLKPFLSAIAMSLSSITVLLNSLRIGFQYKNENFSKNLKSEQKMKEILSAL